MRSNLIVEEDAVLNYKKTKLFSGVYLIWFICFASLLGGVGFTLDFYFERHGYYCDRLTLDGDISPESFIQAKDCLQNSSARKKVFVVKSSGGGDAEAALALAQLIHKFRWDVEVQNVCASACANYIFPSGNRKYLYSKALLLFHGGPLQVNLPKNAMRLDQAQLKTEVGETNKEATLLRSSTKSFARAELRKFLGVNRDITAEGLVSELIRLTDDLYMKLNINRVLPTYGQMGIYESKYKSYKYSGFYYSIASLNKLGVKNIMILGNEWHPELHPSYSEVYEAEFP